MGLGFYILKQVLIDLFFLDGGLGVCHDLHLPKLFDAKEMVYLKIQFLLLCAAFSGCSKYDILELYKQWAYGAVYSL